MKKKGETKDIVKTCEEEGFEVELAETWEGLEFMELGRGGDGGVLG